MHLDAKDFALPLNSVQDVCPDILKFINSQGKIDLGNSLALYSYNKCLFKILDDIILDLETEDEKFINLIPTAGLRRLITSVIIEHIHPNKIIEIGTGATAIMALLLAKKSVHVIATEIDNYSYLSAKRHIKINKLDHHITLVKSEGEILNYLENFFPVDCVLSLPPYYANETKNDNRKKSGFRGTESELYSFGESTDFSTKLLQEWNEIDSIQSICILWKDYEDFQKGLNFQKAFPTTIQTFEVKAGTRTRYLTLIKKNFPEK